VAAVACVSATVVVLAGIGTGGYTGQAVFTDVRGLVTRGSVRVDGVVAGAITSLRLTRRNAVLVRYKLDSGVPHPRADASAAILPADLFGDNYMSLSLGRSSLPLRGPIPVGRTANVGRIDALLNVFQPNVRSGLGALIVELGLGLQSRGVDVNGAIIKLRPAFDDIQRVMSELGSENADLSAMITNANRVSTQAASRDADLGPLIDALARTVSTTAAHAPALRADLSGLPATLSALRATTVQLTATAQAARPFAESLAAAAPSLATASDRLSPFLDQARTSLHALTPTLTLAGTFLAAGRQTFPELASGLRSLDTAAPGINGLSDTLAASAPAASQTFFVNIAGEGQEPGNQPFDPFTNPLRHYWRGAAVLTCQTFGVPIEPGCLTNYLNATSPLRVPRVPRPTTVSAPAAHGAPAAPSNGPHAGAAPTGSPGAPTSTGQTALPGSSLVSGLTGTITSGVSKLLGTTGPAGAVQHLLHFLLSP
jgi:ABC-type transporter Mla subunit MlaD